MKIHKLKIEPDFLKEIYEGNKTCEIRYCADRDFQKGDLIEMSGYYENHYIAVVLEITHVLCGWGLEKNHAALSFRIKEKL